jgi:hypothetical protein
MQKLLPLLIISSLYGHDLYLMPQNFRPAAGEATLISAHTGDSFPFSEQPVDPARLTSLPANEWRMLGKATHATMQVQPGSQYFGVFTKPRFLEMEAAKFIDYLKEEGLTTQLEAYSAMTGKSREMYSKFAKTYIVAGQSSGNFSTPLGLKIEIVPQADPSHLKPGDELPVQLLFDGTPLADIQMEIATSRDPRTKSVLTKAGRTNSKGMLSIPVPASGKIRLHAVAMKRVKAETHDWESYWASLTFEVPSATPTQSSKLTNR